MPDLYACELGWYALKATTKREHLAAELLRREAGVEAFCPRIGYTKKTKRGKVRFVEALFPGYLFVRTELRETFRHIMSISGVSGVVRYGNRVPPIPEAFIAELRERLATDTDTIDAPEVPIREGQTVTLLEGPFKDWTAIVKGTVPAKDRVALLLEFMGRVLEIEIAARAILAEDENDAKARAFGIGETEKGVKKGVKRKI